MGHAREWALEYSRALGVAARTHGFCGYISRIDCSRRRNRTVSGCMSLANCLTSSARRETESAGGLCWTCSRGVLIGVLTIGGGLDRVLAALAEWQIKHRVPPSILHAVPHVLEWPRQPEVRPRHDEPQLALGNGLCVHT